MIQLVTTRSKSLLHAPTECIHTKSGLLYMYIYLSRAVDFVLKDPREKGQSKPLPKAPHQLELDVVPKPWAKDVHRAYSAMTQTLFVTNPTLNAVLSLWYRSYSGVRLGMFTIRCIFFWHDWQAVAGRA